MSIDPALAVVGRLARDQHHLALMTPASPTMERPGSMMTWHVACRNGGTRRADCLAVGFDAADLGAIAAGIRRPVDHAQVDAPSASAKNIPQTWPSALSHCSRSVCWLPTWKEMP
jgi:hypothetical protein